MEETKELIIKCPIHKKQSQYFCLKLLCKKETTRFICDKCLKEGPHKNHENIEINELHNKYQNQIQNYVKQQSQCLEKDLQLINLYIDTYIPEKFIQIQKDIANSFQKVNDQLMQQLQQQKKMLEQNNQELKKLSDIDFQNLNQNQMNDLAKFLKDSKPVIQFNTLYEQYYDEFITNIKAIQENWSKGLGDYFENFDKSLNLQVNQKQRHDEEDLQPFNLELFKSEKQFSLKGHQETVFSLILMNNLYGENTDLLVSGSSDHTVKVWDLQKKKCIKTLKPPDENDFYSIYCLLKINETKFVFGSTDKTIKIYDYFELIGVLQGHENDILSLAKVNESNILSGSHDNTIRLWDLDKFECLRVYKEHTESIDTYCLQLLDNENFVSVSNDLTIKVWNLQSENSNLTIKMNDFGVDTIASMIIYDKQRIITGNHSYFSIWDFEQKKVVHKEEKVFEGYILCITQLDIDIFIMGSDNENAKIFRIYEENNQFKVQLVKSLVQVHEDAAIRSIIKYGNQRFITGGADDKIVVWQ